MTEILQKQPVANRLFVFPNAPRRQLNTYDLDPGDVIHINNGTYTLTNNIRILPADSGVRLEGPQSGPGQAIIDRNVYANNVALLAIELAGMDNATFDRLVIKKGGYGVYAAFGTDSDKIVVGLKSEVSDFGLRSGSLRRHS